MVLLPFFLLLISSCEKKTAETNLYSAPFLKIFGNFNKLYDQHKASAAVHYLDTSFKYPDNFTAEDRFRAYAMRYMFHHKVSHNFKKELPYADSMLMMAKREVNSPHYPLLYAEANFALGDSYFDLGQYNNAYQCFYQGYYMGKNTLKFDILGEYTYRMGMLMFKQAHYAEAAKFFKESYQHGLGYKKNFRTFYQRQELIDNIGESYMANHDIDSAKKYFARTLAYIDENDGKYKVDEGAMDLARSVVYGNQGEIARWQDKHQDAEILLNKSLDINGLKHRADVYNAEVVSINLGKLYLDKGDDKKFVSLFTDLRKALDSIKNEQAEADWNRLMSNYYAKKNAPAKALTYLHQYNSLKDSVLKRSSSLKEIDVIQQQANYDNEHQILGLKNNNRQQQIYIYLAVTCAALALVIIVLVLRNWKKSKRDVLVFSTLNKQIGQQKNNLEATLNELNRNSQEKDRILRAVAHDLRNPIGGIASLTLAMEDDDFTPGQKEMINLIKETSTDSLELINEILEVANNESADMVKSPVDINAVVSKSVELLRFKAAEKSQEIELELMDAHEELSISREKIWRVISNLISNALKFSPYGSVVKVSVTAVADEIKIAVKDAGIGIPDNIKEKVFNMFTEAKRAGTAGEKSFGLGLSISKQIIENHKGKIWFESSEKGTTFYVTLTRQKAEKTVKPSRNQHTTVPSV